MNNVLYVLCRHCLSIMDGWYPYPSTVIAEQLGISLYRVRKELKRLKELGLVVSTMYCWEEEYGNYILRGYTITDKARATKEYKEAYEREEKIRQECLSMAMLKEEACVFEELRL